MTDEGEGIGKRAPQRPRTAEEIATTIWSWTEVMQSEPDPLERARWVTRLLEARRETGPVFRRIRAQAVGELRSRGMSHDEIARAIGVSRSRAQQLADEAAQLENGGDCPPEPLED